MQKINAALHAHTCISFCIVMISSGILISRRIFYYLFKSFNVIFQCVKYTSPARDHICFCQETQSIAAHQTHPNSARTVSLIDQFVVTRWLDNSLNKYYKNADWDLFIKADGMMDVNTFYNVPKTTIQTGAHGGMFFYCLSKLNDCCHICMIMKRNLVEYLMNFKFTL